MRLIDADAVVKRIVLHGEPIGDYNIGLKIGFDTIRKLIDNAPDVDAVPVIRCGDCKYYHYSHKEQRCDLCNKVLLLPDDFCSYGERKEPTHE